MLRYLGKRVSILLLSLFVVVTLTFILMRAVPGDPFTQEQAVPEEIMRAMHRYYGLDRPLYIQYLNYLKGLFVFDLGPSLKYQGRFVSQIIFEGFPVSATLGIQALVIALFCGIGFGSLAAFHYGRWQDRAIMVVAVLGISIPSFILATLFQYIFCMKLSLFPVARWGGWSHTVLPALAISALPMAFIARLTRSSMIETLQQDFILTARSKGLNRYQILLRHVLRNSILPVVTYLGPLIVMVVTGSFAIEKIFGVPGLGQWFVTSIMNRDYPVIMGITVFYSALLIPTIFLIDLIYSLIDPRIRNEYKRNS